MPPSDKTITSVDTNTTSKREPNPALRCILYPVVGYGTPTLSLDSHRIDGEGRREKPIEKCPDPPETPFSHPGLHSDIRA